MEGKVTAEAGDGGVTAALAGYERLAELAEAELAACEAGRFEELEPHYAEAAALVATLPQQPPAAARAALQRAEQAQGAVAAILGVGLAETRAELGRLRRGRDAARSYGATAKA